MGWEAAGRGSSGASRRSMPVALRMAGDRGATSGWSWVRALQERPSFSRTGSHWIARDRTGIARVHWAGCGCRRSAAGQGGAGVFMGRVDRIGLGREKGVVSGPECAAARPAHR